MQIGSIERGLIPVSIQRHPWPNTRAVIVHMSLRTCMLSSSAHRIAFFLGCWAMAANWQCSADEPETQREVRSQIPVADDKKKPYTLLAHALRSMAGRRTVDEGGGGKIKREQNLEEVGEKIEEAAQKKTVRSWTAEQRHQHRAACKSKSKLSLGQKLDIITQHQSCDPSSRRTQAQLALMYGKSRSAISKILRPENISKLKNISDTGVHMGTRL